jgi:hypothetical protein
MEEVKEKNISPEFHTMQKYPSKVKKKYFLKQTASQHTYSLRNKKRSSS